MVSDDTGMNSVNPVLLEYPDEVMSATGDMTLLPPLLPEVVVARV